jgi:hypothetical protein
MELIAVAQLQSRCHQWFRVQSGLVGIEHWSCVFNLHSIPKASDEDLRSVAPHFPKCMCFAVHSVGLN